MLSNARFIVTAVLMAIGIISGAIGILGIYRFKFVMNRMHCAAIIDTLSMSSILAALMVATGNISYIPKLVAIMLVLWISSPIASHIVGKMEFDSDDSAKSHVVIDEEKDDKTDGNS